MAPGAFPELRGLFLYAMEAAGVSGRARSDRPRRRARQGTDAEPEGFGPSGLSACRRVTGPSRETGGASAPPSPPPPLGPNGPITRKRRSEATNLTSPFSLVRTPQAIVHTPSGWVAEVQAGHSDLCLSAGGRWCSHERVTGEPGAVQLLLAGQAVPERLTFDQRHDIVEEPLRLTRVVQR